MRRSRLRYAACALAIGVAGCSLLGGTQTSLKTAPPPADRPQADLTAITPALEMMRALPSADPARQAELFQSMKDAALEVCPKEQCRLDPWGHGKVKRLLGTGAGLIFKGSGFYVTDYRSQSYKESAKKESGAKEGGTKESGGGKTDSGAAKSGGGTGSTGGGAASSSSKPAN